MDMQEEKMKMIPTNCVYLKLKSFSDHTMISRCSARCCILPHLTIAVGVMFLFRVLGQKLLLSSRQTELSAQRSLYGKIKHIIAKI